MKKGTILGGLTVLILGVGTIGLYKAIPPREPCVHKTTFYDRDDLEFSATVYSYLPRDAEDLWEKIFIDIGSDGTLDGYETYSSFGVHADYPLVIVDRSVSFGERLEKRGAEPHHFYIGRASRGTEEVTALQTEFDRIRALHEANNTVWKHGVWNWVADGEQAMGSYGAVPHYYLEDLPK